MDIHMVNITYFDIDNHIAFYVFYILSPVIFEAVNQ